MKRGESFGKIAKEYDRYREPHPKVVFDFLFSLLKARPASILDVGCGTGKSTEPLVRKGTRASGCDPDPRMLKEALRRAKLLKLPIQYKQGRAEYLPFKKNSFDAVTVGSAFHWFANIKALQEIKRVLKPGGLLFIFNRFPPNKKAKKLKVIEAPLFRRYGIPFHPKRVKSLIYFTSLLRKAGLKNIRIRRIPYTRKVGLRERVGYIKTTSAYASLSQTAQKEVLEKAEILLRRRLGKRKTFVIPRVIGICYGYKPEKAVS